jgi:hypothetical protein
MKAFGILAEIRTIHLQNESRTLPIRHPSQFGFVGNTKFNEGTLGLNALFLTKLPG